MNILLLLLTLSILVHGKTTSPVAVLTKDDDFKTLTKDRIAALPDGERLVWLDYLDRSKHLEETERSVVAEECRSNGKT